MFKDGYVTPANYIAEIIFKKRAEHFESGMCAIKFWNMKKNKGPYRGQVIQASRLLKKYRDSSIIKALQSREAKYILKLNHEKLIPLIEKFEKQYKDTEFKKTEKKENKKMKPFGKGKNMLEGL